MLSSGDNCEKIARCITSIMKQKCEIMLTSFTAFPRVKPIGPNQTTDRTMSFGEVYEQFFCLQGSTLPKHHETWCGTE